jgi:hypothetical protein
MNSFHCVKNILFRMNYREIEGKTQISCQHGLYALESANKGDINYVMQM